MQALELQWIKSREQVVSDCQSTLLMLLVIFLLKFVSSIWSYHTKVRCFSVMALHTWNESFLYHILVDPAKSYITLYSSITATIIMRTGSKRQAESQKHINFVGISYLRKRTLWWLKFLTDGAQQGLWEYRRKENKELVNPVVNVSTSLNTHKSCKIYI